MIFRMHLNRRAMSAPRCVLNAMLWQSRWTRRARICTPCLRGSRNPPSLLRRQRGPKIIHMENTHERRPDRSAHSCQPYRLACAPEKQAALLEAAARVDAEMNKVRSHSAIRGTDRIAVMAAISLASELLLLQRSVQCGEAVPAQEIQTIVQRLNQQIGTALEPHDLLSPEDHADNIAVE